MNNNGQTPKRNKRNSRSLVKLENSPPVHSLKDLINIGKTIRYFANIDTIMLWRLIPYLEQLQNLVGMKRLKESLFLQIIYYLKKMHRRNQNEEYLHTVIQGSPGTGKTTVAKIIGKIYQALGVLSLTGKFKIAYRDDFIAEYLGQTAVKTRKLLNSCIGGVLVIDECYSLGNPENRDSFSKEALDILTGYLSEHKNDMCCILVGYEKDIQQCIFKGNSGLERRFPWVHTIEEYTPDDLAHIFMKKLKEMKWDKAFDHKFVSKLIGRDKKLFKFAGGDIETFLSKCKMLHAKRVFNLDSEHQFVLTQKDLLNAIEYIKRNTKLKNDEPPLSMYM
jgi:SpoVK/Ycf46/Vps4 family AAA+-type ATPase